MPITTPDKPIRLRTPADIIGAVPYLLGFPPQNSLVVIALSGERNRSGVVARNDLPAPEWADALAEQTIGYLRRDGAERVAMVFYPPRDGPEHPSVRPIADVLKLRLASASIGITEMLCVGPDRWWSLSCDSGCCPKEGTPIDPEHVSVVAVASAVHGKTLLNSRDELVRSVEPVGGLAAAAMKHALPPMRETLATRAAEGDRWEVVDETVELFRRAVGERLDVRRPRSALGVDDAARLIAGLDDVVVRDTMISWFEDDWGTATLSLFAELVPRAVPPFHIVPLTVLGWLAYLRGNGALAGIAVDQVLDTGPGNGMLRILDDALRAALDPSTFQASMRELGGILARP